MTVDKSNLSLDQTVVVSGAGGVGSPGVQGADGKGGIQGDNATVPQFGANGGPGKHAPTRTRDIGLRRRGRTIPSCRQHGWINSHNLYTG